MELYSEINNFSFLPNFSSFSPSLNLVSKWFLVFSLGWLHVFTVRMTADVIPANANVGINPCICGCAFDEPDMAARRGFSIWLNLSHTIREWWRFGDRRMQAWLHGALYFLINQSWKIVSFGSSEASGCIFGVLEDHYRIFLVAV